MRNRKDLKNDLMVINGALTRDKLTDSTNHKINDKIGRSQPLRLVRRNSIAFSGRILRGNTNKRDKFNVGLASQLV
jgi:hypothetical protein